MSVGVDVAIVGAGPGGGMAACRLAPTGARIAILEKEHLPRHKACGGALSGGVREILDWDISPWIENEVRQRRNLFDYAREQVGQIEPFLLVNRGAFDAHLIERAVTLGNGRVDLRQGFRVAHVEEKERGIIVHSQSGERLEADFVIGADGAFSTVARSLELNRDVTRGPALDAEVEVTPEVYDTHKNTVTFNFFCLPHGYGWIFPKRAGLLSCGICAWAGRPKLAEALNDFLTRSLPPDGIRRVETYGHVVPLYSGARQIATRRACLVGDAANLVDPILGEGIGFALQSGAIAADVIAGLLGAGGGSRAGASPEADCQAYQALIQEGIGARLDHLLRFVQIVFLGAPELFYRRFILRGNDQGSPDAA